MDRVIMRNISSLIGIQGMNFLIPLITLPYLVRVLEPSGYGVFGFATAVIQYFCIFTDYGFNLSATQKASVTRYDKKNISQLFWAVMVCKILLCISGFLFLFALVNLVDQFREIKLVLYSSYGLVVGNLLFPIWLFQGKEFMGWIAISNIAARLISIPLIFIFVIHKNDAWLAGMINGFSAILAGLISLFIVYRKKWIYWSLPQFSQIIREFKDGWHVFISTAAISLYTTSTTVILGFIAGPISVGYFVAADKIRQAIQGLISPVSQAFYPRVNKLMSENKKLAFSLIRHLLLFLGGGALLTSLLLYFSAEELIKLIYGESYQYSIDVLKILACTPFIVALSNIFGVQTLLVLGKKKTFSCILVMAGIVSILTLLPLSIYFQQNGAAFSVVMTEFTVSVAMFSYIVKSKIPLLK
ncbi:flippase [Pectobacterium parmentieri]|uniref:Flippase n=1 Tax=Pectobacterium parmentieri TaxID=1905730 RepID=A0ABS0S408_PECPM|nr:flippase [Pectobacterium parmentieri]